MGASYCRTAVLFFYLPRGEDLCENIQDSLMVDQMDKCLPNLRAKSCESQPHVVRRELFVKQLYLVIKINYVEHVVDLGLV